MAETEGKQGGYVEAMLVPSHGEAVVIARPVELPALESPHPAGKRSRQAVPGGKAVPAANSGEEKHHQEPDADEQGGDDVAKVLPKDLLHGPYPPAGMTALPFVNATRRRATAAGVTPGILWA